MQRFWSFTSLGLQLLILTLGLQLLRRVLEPKLMSNSIGISTLQSLIAMFAGLQFGGIPGLIGGPVIMSVLVGAYHADLHGRTMRDIRTVVRFFHNRWKDEETVPEGDTGEKMPGDGAGESLPAGGEGPEGSTPDGAGESLPGGGESRKTGTSDGAGV